MKVITIIGAGLSGTLTAINIAENAGEDIKIIVLEKSSKQRNRGVAYQQQFTVQPLNVVASKMSLYINRPTHFIEWLTQNNLKYADILPEFDGNTFVPRSIYGDYIEDTANKYKTRISYNYSDATAIAKNNSGQLEIITDKGETITSDYLILAIGNFPPSDHTVLRQQNIAMSGMYKPFPWQEGIFNSVKKTDTITIIGSGLTMLDMLLKLKSINHEGEIFVLSRNGFIPQEHSNIESYTIELPHNLEYTAYGILVWIRGLIKKLGKEGVDWRAVVDGLRIHTSQIWKQLPYIEKQVFLKRLRPFWETHRHRMPRSTQALVQKLTEEGRLHIYAASLQNAEAGEGKIRLSYINKKTSESAEIAANLIINCTGPESDYRKLNTPVVNSLISKGILCTDELNIGIKTDDNGNLINQEGNIESKIYAIGPLRKGTLWESTALKEIREQSELIVKKILNEL